MRKTSKIVHIEISEEKHILINSLNGSIFELTKEEMQEWENLTISNDANIEAEKNSFLALLKEKQFFLSEAEEEEVEKALIEKLRNQQKVKCEKSKDLTFVLTYDCNFACPYCYECKNDIADRKKVISKEMVDKALALYDNTPNTIGFFGGEPLLPKTRDIIEYIVERCPNAHYSIITNGYYLEEYIDLLKKMNIIRIQVTLDGSEELHNKTRKLKEGGGSYKKIISGIKECLENGIRIKVRMNVSKANYESCCELKKTLLEEYKEYREYLGFEMSPIFQLKSKEKEKLFDGIYADYMKLGTQGNDNRYVETDLPIVNFFACGTKLSPTLSYCDGHTSRRFFDALGDVYSCILAVGKQNMKIGKYYPDYELDENSMINRDITKIEKCKKCNKAFLCGGGCPLDLTEAGKSIFEANCSNMEFALNYRIPTLYKMKMDY